MNRYVQTAINTAKICIETKANPREMWKIEAEKIFAKGSSSITKAGPRGTFLSLCEMGVVKGIPSGNYTEATVNKIYAAKGVEIIKNDKRFANSPKTIWKMINPSGMSYSFQMDVVCALYKEGLLNI